MTNTISQTISSFFKYATPDNYHKKVNQSTNSDNQVRTQLIYANCVRCNEPRFTPATIPFVRTTGRFSTDEEALKTYFCPPCLKDAITFKREHETGFATPKSLVFYRLWYAALYEGPKARSKL